MDFLKMYVYGESIIYEQSVKKTSDLEHAFTLNFIKYILNLRFPINSQELLLLLILLYIILFR